MDDVTRFNVYAVIGGTPIAKQNEKPLTHGRALQLAARLEKGKMPAQRVLITRA